ncbi:MAG: response regulator [Myxococcaceae bacterium]|nr:response regulator [Myxococcaceae bacterium]
MNRRLTGSILVIDDDKSARLLLERVLKRVGHKVRLVDNGQQGLDAMAKESFDVLICDRNLPDVDGMEVLQKAHTRHPTMKTVIVTGSPTAQLQSSAEALGIFAYVAKPFALTELVSACEGALRARHGGAS